MEVNRVKIILLYFLFFVTSLYSAVGFGGMNLPYNFDGIGGKASGMGGAFVSISDDGTALFYNPAGISRVRNKIFTINYQNSFLGNANLLYLSYISKLGDENHGIGVSFLYNGVSDMISYTSEQISAGTYSFSHLQISFGYGINLNRFQIGSSLKFYNFNISTYSGNTIDLDLGIIFSLKNFSSGLIFQNILPLRYSIYSERESIPLNSKLGISYKISRINLTFSYDIEKQIEPSFSVSPFLHHFGLRFDYKFLNILAGYNVKSFTIGLNILISQFSFFTGTSIISESSKLNFSVSYNLPEVDVASKEMEYFYEGVAAYQNRDYRTAIKFFEKVLEIRDNAIARYYLENSKSYLESELWMSEEDKAVVGLKFELAQKYYSQGFYGKAIQALREVLNLGPNNSEAESLMNKIKAKVKNDVENYYNKAFSLFKAGQYEDSLRECENGLELDPEHKPTVELKQKNEAILKDKLLAKKQEEERKAEAEALFKQGLFNYQKENWIEALNNFKKSYEIIQNPEVKDYLQRTENKLKEIELTEKQKKESEVHLKLGIDFYNKNQIKEALVEFEKAVNIYPNNEEAVRYLNEARAKYDSIINEPLEEGKRALRSGELSKAIENFKKVLKIDPQNQVALEFLNKANSLVKDYIKSNLKLAENYYDKKDYGKALGAYREVLNLEPDNKEAKKGVEKVREKISEQLKAHYDKGLEYFNKEKLKEAIDELKKALELDPEYILAKQLLEQAEKKYEENKAKYTIQENLEIGIDYFQNKNYTKAKEYFTKVLEIDPNHKEAKDYLEKTEKELEYLKKQEEIAQVIGEGMIAFRRKKFNEAIEIWQKAKEKDPENKLIDEYIEYAKRSQAESINKFYNEGLEYLKNGDLLSAKDSFEKAVQSDPQFKEAQSKLTEVKSLILQKIHSSKNKGKEEFKNGNYEEAIKYFNEVLSYEKDNEEVADLLRSANEALTALNDGKALLKKGDYSEAIEKFNLVLDLNNNDKKVQDYINEALLLGKKQSADWFNDGMKYYQNGDLKKALVRFSSVVKVNPEHKEAQEMLKKVSSEIETKCAKLYNEALSYYNNGDYKNSISRFEAILGLVNDYKDTRSYLSKARSIYNKLTEKERQASSEKVQEYLFNGIKFYRDEKYEEAIAEWEKVLKIDPNNDKALKYISRAKYKLQQLEKLK